jgi:uncharacterized protein (DUF1330 family)
MRHYFVAQIRINDPFEDWYYSDDYQAILKHSLKASDCDTILVEGVD